MKTNETAAEAYAKACAPDAATLDAATRLTGAGGFDNSDAAEGPRLPPFEAAISPAVLDAGVAIVRETINTSRIVPTEYKILVLPDDVPERSAGGIVIPPWCRDQRQGAAQTGVVIAIADEAYSFVEDRERVRIPKVGERIAYTKYAGMTLAGFDKKIYKLMNDKDVAGILEFAFDPKDYQF